MKHAVGRPKKQNKTVLMAFRFRPEYAALIRRISKVRKMRQRVVLETALNLFSKEIGA